MITREAGSLRVAVPMVMANAGGLLEAGRAVLQQKDETIDLKAVTEADSSALAVMLGWMRTAQARGGRLQFVNTPPGVRSLADLYGVAELLPLA